MKCYKLAIVIPAYKIDFFDDSLKSIANQTCKDFTLYIGNDASEFDFETIIKKYDKIIPIFYKKFDKNLGRVDLVRHWERCIDLTQNEEWIWLFSDDDFIDPNCVENFYKTLTLFPNHDLYHFNVIQVNQKSEVFKTEKEFPSVLKSEDYIKLRLDRKIMSLVVEYIFRKEHFLNEKRFVKFDLAWGSDDATWIKLGNPRGIRSIENSYVYWRRSNLNISCNKDAITLSRKYHARICFIEWLINYNINNNKFLLSRKYLEGMTMTWFLNFLKGEVSLFTYSELKELLLALTVKLNKNAAFMYLELFLLLIIRGKEKKRKLINKLIKNE